MKRSLFLRHLKDYDCALLREGKRHSIFYNQKTERTSSVPRHREIDNFLAKKICKDLGISDCVDK